MKLLEQGGPAHDCLDSARTEHVNCTIRIG